MLAQSTRFFVDTNSGKLIRSCNYNIALKMDMDGGETNSIDSKFFLSGLQIENISAVDVNNMMVLTGIATTGDHIGEEYIYINVYQSDSNNALSGSDINIANLNVIVETGTQTTGFIDFYFVQPLWNGDDSNIPIGTDAQLNNNYTQYHDSLSSVVDGYYTLQDGNCDELIYILSGYYNQYITVESGNTVSISNNSLSAGPTWNYPGFYAGDNLWDSNVNDTGRTYWTNTAVYLNITGNTNLQIMTGFLSGLPVRVVNNYSGTTNKTLIITGNVLQPLYFQDITANSGNLYQYNNITGVFYIDVFWIDKTGPIVTGNYVFSGTEYLVTLTGTIGGVNWTTKDDEFKITMLSGMISAPTSYLVSGNDTFDIKHNLIFTGVRSGDVYYIDRAGNTGSYFLDIRGPQEYGIKVYPDSRLITSLTPSPNYATLGTLNVYTTSNIFVDSGVFDISTNNYGTGIAMLMTELSGTYNATFQGLSHLQSILTGVTINSGNKLFDFTLGSPGLEIPGEIIRDGEINGVDSSVIIQYISDNGATNTNNNRGFIPEDLNANGQVDAADLTILGYNLYKTNTLLP